MKTVKLIHHYDHPADAVWHVVTDLDHLQTVTSGLLTFKSLPSGKIYKGQDLSVDVSLFGVLPYQPYHMRVVELDDARRFLQSDERGVGVKTWRHALTVVPSGTGCRIEEQIEVDAGLKTSLFAAWAKFMYRRRHAPRLQILENLTEFD